MKRTIYLILLVVSLILLAGCQKDGNWFYHLLGGDTHRYYSFIHRYYGMNVYDIEVYSRGVCLELIQSEENLISEAFSLCCDATDYDKSLAEKHRILSEKYGDTNESEWWSSKYEFGRYALADAFVDLDIVSDVDYDDEHPAGTSLADIVRVSFRTFYPFISGDTKRAGSENVCKFVAELTPKDLTLVEVTGDTFGFYFETLPQLARQHNFTVTFITDGGVEYAYTWYMDFGESTH